MSAELRDNLQHDLQQVVRESRGKVLLQVQVQPRARQNKLAGIREGALRVLVTAAPVDGAANDAVIAALAQALRLSKSTFTLWRGAKSRHKTFQIKEVPATTLRKLLAEHIEQNR